MEMKVGSVTKVSVKGRELTVCLDKHGYMVWDEAHAEPNFPYFVSRLPGRIEAKSCREAADVAVGRGL